MVIGCSFMVIGYWLLVIGCSFMVIGYWLLVNRSWLLVIGCSFMVIGYWLLVIGYWLIVHGYWLFVHRECLGNRVSATWNPTFFVENGAFTHKTERSHSSFMVSSCPSTHPPFHSPTHLPFHSPIQQHMKAPYVGDRGYS